MRRTRAIPYNERDMAGIYDPEKHHRRSIRRKGYDYTDPGGYFVTICTWNRESLFGEVIDGALQIGEYGKIVRQEWERAEEVRPHVELDEYIIMPNHLHGILIMNTPVGARRCLDPYTANVQNRVTRRVAPTTIQSNSLGALIGQFKSLATKRINRSRNHPGMPVWQRNYYERIIRNETEMNRIRQYIINNPSQWANDENNPVNFLNADV